MGSLGHYSTDWNGADMSEVSSANPHSRPHLAGPSMLAQKMHAMKVAVLEADKVAAVNTHSSLLHFPAEYALSLVPEIRVE